MFLLCVRALAALAYPSLSLTPHHPSSSRRPTDCKHISEAALVQALERTAGGAPSPSSPPSPDDKEGEGPFPPSPPSLKVLRLRWCGQAFGKPAIDAFARLGLGQELEALELTGLYRLKDEEMIEMVAAVS